MREKGDKEHVELAAQLDKQRSSTVSASQVTVALEAKMSELTSKLKVLEKLLEQQEQLYVQGSSEVHISEGELKAAKSNIASYEKQLAQSNAQERAAMKASEDQRHRIKEHRKSLDREALALEVFKVPQDFLRFLRNQFDTFADKTNDEFPTRKLKHMMRRQRNRLQGYGIHPWCLKEGLVGTITPGDTYNECCNLSLSRAAAVSRHVPVHLPLLHSLPWSCCYIPLSCGGNFDTCCHTRRFPRATE